MTRLSSIGLVVALLAATAVSTAAPPTVEDLMMDMRITALGGQEPPPFVVKGLDGGTTRLSDVRGQVALVYFWATW